ncbi:MAG: BatA domain-containing protein [Lentisphaeraceae bacterium]|nr:BatA domain-containing protein [Lentisphaeraceae bacterium]
MNFLAASFLIGALAVAAPIYIHMIRKTPANKFVFSSLRFLTPSPETQASRSSIEHWLLLLIRALIIALLCLAFARPYIISNLLNTSNKTNAAVLYLVDTSASMNQPDFKKLIETQFSEQISTLEQKDFAAIYSFDKHIYPVRDFNEANLKPTEYIESLRSIEPSWSQSDFAQALQEATDRLSRLIDEKQLTKADIEVFTDLQADDQLEKIRQTPWPKNINVIIHKLSSDKDNASIHLSRIDNEDIKLKIVNHADITQENITVTLLADGKSYFTEEFNLIANQSKFINVPIKNFPDSTKNIVAKLKGDELDFDNTSFITMPQKQTKNISYLTDEGHKTGNNLFYLSQFFPSGNSSATLSETLTANKPNLIVIDKPLSVEQIKQVKDFTQAGATTIFLAKNVKRQQTLNALLKSNISIKSGSVTDYLMLSNIDFSHWLFSPYAEARFKDFSSIHFWKYRELVLPENHDLNIIASFDNQSPAVMSKALGKGEVIVMASSWAKEDSQLAVNSKFIPFVLSLLNASSRNYEDSFNHTFSNSLSLPQGEIRDAQNEVISKIASIGSFSLKNDEQSFLFSVNSPQTESSSKTFNDKDILQTGIKLVPRHELEKHLSLRHTNDSLEKISNKSTQSNIWQYLLMAVVALIILETVIGHTTYKRMTLNET